MASVCFNSRSREGSDILICQKIKFYHKVSTRAPVKGATVVVDTVVCALRGFNSRSREGSDGKMVETLSQLVFVSTHAPVKGATLDVRRIHTIKVSFNSRSREGSDCRDISPDISTIAFQLTLP